MADIITDTKTLTITVIEHGDIQITNVTAPPAVEMGEPFDITYTIVNNGNTDTCYGIIQAFGDSRWDETIDAGATKTKSYTVATGIDDTLNTTIEVGYTK